MLECRKCVLAVEDDRSLLAVLEYNLVHAGHNVLTARDGAQCLHLARTCQVDLIILDLNLPHLNGMDVCTALRKEGNQVPILMITAREGPDSCVEGLRRGADDYVTKPFELSELMARVESNLRRSELAASKAQSVPKPEPGRTLTVGNLHVDFVKRKATKGDGESVSLRPRECDMLNFLASRGGRVVSRKEICDAVWEGDQVGATKAVDVHISLLRAKIEEDRKNPQIIITVHGKGYRFNP